VPNSLIESLLPERNYPGGITREENRLGLFSSPRNPDVASARKVPPKRGKVIHRAVQALVSRTLAALVHGPSGMTKYYYTAAAVSALIDTVAP